MPEITLDRIEAGGGDPRLNVVFLHGLGGDPITTWRNDNGFNWPNELAEELPGLAVYSIGYPGDKASWNSGWPIAQVAVAILDRLISDRILRTTNTPIIFICHSLGGLIVKKLILTAESDRGQDAQKRKFLNRVAGVVFLATPHAGSFMATIARQFHWFVSNSLSDLGANDENLRDLSVSYRNWVADDRARIRHRVYYETRGVFGAPPVDATSADPGITGVRPVAIGRDHIALCKPNDRRDQVYEGVLAFLDEAIEPRSPPFRETRTIAMSGRKKARAPTASATEMTSTVFDVFLSHSHLDSSVVGILASKLTERANLRVWLDRWMLVPGNHWQQEMARGLEQARTCAVCVGRHTPKGWFREEIERALNRQVKEDGAFRVIPVILPNGDRELIDEFLELRTWVDFREGIDDAAALNILVSGIFGKSPGRFPSHEDADDDNLRMAVERLKTLKNLREQRLIGDEIHNEYQRKILDEVIYRPGE